RQILSVEYLVLRDNTVLREKEGSDRINLVRFQRAFLAERHSAIDVVPNYRRVRRVKRHYIVPADARREARRQFHRGIRLYQLGSAPFVSTLAVARRTLLRVKLFTFFRASVPLRELLAIRTNRDIPRANFFRGWSLSQTIGGRLCPR